MVRTQPPSLANRASHPRGGLVAPVLVAGIMLLMLSSSTLPSPFYPDWQTKLGLDTVTVTILFAVYPVALLATLLVGGTLSDHLGRRPVLSLSLALLALSMVVFVLSSSAPAIIVARIVQGIAVGLSLTVTAAAFIELVERARPLRGRAVSAVVNATVPTFGLAVGAVLAGAGLDLLRDAQLIVFGIVGAIAALLAVAVWFLPETAPRRPGLLRSLRPVVGIPSASRATFIRVAPAIVASWMTGGLFISLGSTIVRDVFAQTGHTVQVLTVAIVATVGVAAVLVMRSASARAVFTVGAGTLALGTAGGVVAAMAHSLPGYLIAAAITGWGFGTAYAGALRLLIPTAPDGGQAGLFAAVYVLAYISFALPAVLAGAAVSIFGLAATVTAYGAVVFVVSLIALVRRGAAAAG